MAILSVTCIQLVNLTVEIHFLIVNIGHSSINIELAAIYSE